MKGWTSSGLSAIGFVDAFANGDDDDESKGTDEVEDKDELDKCCRGVDDRKLFKVDVCGWKSSSSSSSSSSISLLIFRFADNLWNAVFSSEKNSWPSHLVI